MITLVLGGDVTLHGRATPSFGPLEPLLKGADLRFVNLEGPVDAAAAEALKPIGVDVVSVANDAPHPPASLAVLEHAGIAYCGAGANPDAAHTPAVIERSGEKVAFLAYTSLRRPFAAQPDFPVVAQAFATTAYQPDPHVAEIPGRPPLVRTMPVPEHLDRLVADVQRAKSDHDHVVVSMHWGLPGAELAEYQVTYGRAAVDAGADLVAGHGSPTIQAVEVYRGRPILYGLGHLAADRPDGLLAGCMLGDEPRLELIPVRRNAANECEPLGGDEADKVLRYVAEVSTLRSTTVTVQSGIASVSVGA
ncbi:MULTISPECIES: CapA family protein [unclassified Amycolatopsis]|uniref:CapA family protein n=1 Tax=unclassified Amycolatopsis TaxID=2618356 RepID=UPI00287690C4|nr:MULTISPECIES: CapA family protein [unclassified Amycolatopsis]MDS0133868.1 CapA family protein [Amycolatopsis sp. 505]MDS0144744.1 CapA family protein [Amycolatopsis sp. CM201R]